MLIGITREAHLSYLTCLTGEVTTRLAVAAAAAALALATTLACDFSWISPALSAPNLAEGLKGRELAGREEAILPTKKVSTSHFIGDRAT